MSHPEAVATSFLQSVGGREGVSALIEEFYRRVEGEPELRAVYPEDLEPGKANLKLFMEQWLGGGPVYSEKYGHPRLRMRHFPFVIGDRHAGLWLKHMRAAVQARQIPADVERAIFERLGPLARHMVNEGQDVPREPLKDRFLA
jgi:hemoglobin